MNRSMNKKVLLLVISCLSISYTFAQSYKANFIAALNEKKMSQAEEILKAWNLADTNDPELYIAYFNFYTIKSQEANVLNVSGYDQKFSKMALDFITEGIERFPTRFDLRMAKIHMLGELKNYKAYVEEVLNMIRYSVRIQNNWKREEFFLLDRADNMFFDAVLEYQGFLFSKGDPALYKEVIRISEEMLKFYPKNIQSLLNMSTVYVMQSEYDKSLEKLNEAIAIEPKNAILMYNFATVYNRKGDKANAKKYYELTISHCKKDEENLKEAAKMRMAELK